MQRKAVVLPAPFWPSRTSVLPAARLRLSSLTATTSPYRLARPHTSSTEGLCDRGQPLRIFRDLSATQSNRQVPAGRPATRRSDPGGTPATREVHPQTPEQ